MSLAIRKLTSDDCGTIAEAFRQQGWNKPVDQYERYLAEASEGLREVLVAEYDGVFAGYVSVVWSSHHQPFRCRSIPEIVDLNVLKKYQNRGIASELLSYAESLVCERNNAAAVRVGMDVDYGAAQRLYAKRGYVPDGQGIFYNDKQLRYGDTTTVDDDLTLGLIKTLKT